MPLFCNLAFIEASKWRSYHEKEQTFLKSSIDGSIEFLFDKIERKFDPVLIRHAFTYLSAAKVDRKQTYRMSSN